MENKETERIKEIIKNVIEAEINMRRIYKSQSRLNHIKEQIFFKIDNPDYVRKERV